MSKKHFLPLLGALAVTTVPSHAQSQQLLLSPLEADAPIGKGAWMMGELAVAPSKAPAKMGQSAQQLGGRAEIAGAKGDFTLHGAVPGQVQKLGLWVHLTAESNIERLGFQINDGEGESLLATIPADWNGWKQVEIDLPTFTQAYAQADKNKRADAPISGVHVVWFAKAPGATSLSIDALTATTQLENVPKTPEITLAGATVGEPNAPLSTQQIVLTNFGAQASEAKIEWSLQRDSGLFSQAAPDPIYGGDIAQNQKSWSEAAGKRVENNSLTDGKSWTHAELGWGTHSEAMQTVDLGREHQITRIALQPGDANWAWKADFQSSADGQKWTPVAGLQNVDLNKKWGLQVLAPAAPFSARFVRLRHHNGGATVNQISMPSTLSLFDGADKSDTVLPVVGQPIARGNFSLKVPARSFGAMDISAPAPLTSGAYLLSARVENGAQTQLLTRHFLVMPPALASVADSRFGLNTANYQLAPLLRRLGVGWVRFENMKWPMISPAPDEYRFDGTVKPWVVPHDTVVAAYQKQGISVLPFLFQTPDYATSAPEEAKAKGRGDSYPPRDNAQMADFVFQTVARYGSKKHPANVLKSNDKKSGLNQMNTLEIWNEPNLTDPGWGPWVGTTQQYNAMLRAASEAAKRADANARVTNGGVAGIDVETMNTLLLPYADGKKPLDFVDILNVHFYSGRTAPEIVTNDPNADRSGNVNGARTYEDDLNRLVAWRDKHKPGLPIWMTETGYDSAGSFGTNEQFSAARLPRVVMMALASGIDKVMVYRETGSTPSMHASSGLLRNDESLKPAFFTYATLIRELDGVKQGALKLPHPDPNVRLYQWTRGTETVLSAWTIEGSAKLNLALGQSTVTDAFGAVQKTDVSADFPLSMFPIYIKNIGNKAPLQVLATRAKSELAAQQQQNERLKQARAHLFDFGSRGTLGTIDVGDTRDFLGVLGSDVYDEAKGWGFFPTAAGQDNLAHWIKDPLETDSTRMTDAHQFRVKAAAGRYQLRAKVSPFAPAKFTIAGGKNGPQALAIEKDGPVVEAIIEVGTEPITVSTSGYSDIAWLSLVEQIGVPTAKKTP